MIQQLFRESVMRESVIYQDILEKGFQKGFQEGFRKGFQEGLKEGRQERERLLVLRLLTRRLGVIPMQMQAQIEMLSLEQLEALEDALLDFSDTTELESWLNTHLSASNKAMIQQLFREDLTQESVIYQDILNKGLQKGLQEGRQEGRQEGERLLVLRLLARRLGAIPVQMQAQVEALSLEQLEALGEALLEFTELAELEQWLNARL